MRSNGQPAGIADQIGGLVIRGMELSDIDGVRAIEVASFASPWSRASFERELLQNAKVARYIVAEVNGAIAGYGGMWLVMEEAHITNIAVRPGLRGRGVGMAIVAGLIDAARELGIMYMTLECRKSNVAAQNLYGKFGFARVGLRKRYYEDNHEDAVLMAVDNIQSLCPPYLSDECR